MLTQRNTNINDLSIEDIGLPPRKLMLSVPETAFATGLSRTELYDLMSAGVLPYVQVGRRRLIAMEDLHAFVRSHKRTERTKTPAQRYAEAERAARRASQRRSVKASGRATTAAD